MKLVDLIFVHRPKKFVNSVCIRQVLETYHWTSITEFIGRVTFFGKVDETVEEEEEEEEVEDDCLVGD